MQSDGRKEINWYTRSGALLWGGLLLLSLQIIFPALLLVRQSPAAIAAQELSQKNKPPIILTVDGMSLKASLTGRERRVDYLGPSLQQSQTIKNMRGEIKQFGWSGIIEKTKPNLVKLEKSILDAVEDARNDKRSFSIVAHSWGGVLSYLALRNLEKKHLLNPGDVDLLITITTPLGWVDRPTPSLHAVGPYLGTQRLLISQVKTYVKEKLQNPVSVRTWTNYYSTDLLDFDISVSIPVANSNYNTKKGHSASYEDPVLREKYGAEIAAAVAAQGDSIPTIPMPKIYVEDRAEVIDANTEKQLRSRIAEMESKTGVRMIILTQEVPRHLVKHPNTVGHYQTKLTTEWGLGGLEKHIFILFWISKNPAEDRFTWRINSGVITDAKLLRSGSETIGLHGRSRNYSQGIYSAASFFVQQVFLQHEQKQATAAAESFINKYHVKEVVRAETLNKNVFRYKGKRVAMFLEFKKMVSENAALFEGVLFPMLGGDLDQGYVLLTGVPATVFEFGYYTLAIEVLGLVEGRIPHGKYLGSHKGNITKHIRTALGQ